MGGNRYGNRDGGAGSTGDRSGGGGVAAGKRTLTSRLPAVQRRDAASPVASPAGSSADPLPHDDPFGLHLEASEATTDVEEEVESESDTERDEVVQLKASGDNQKKKKKQKAKKKKRGKYDSDSNGRDSFGNLAESERGERTSKDIEHVFTDSLVVLKESPLYDDHAKKTSRTVAKGTRVHFHKVGNSQARISTIDGDPAIAEGDNLWLKCTAVGGTGSDVALGGDDQEDQARADQISSTLPPGRKPGQSRFTWTFNGKFHPAVQGVALDAGLMSKIHRLIEWAIFNDMVTDDINFSWGVRSPKDSHKFNVAYEIRQGHVSLKALQALPGGKDKDGNTWYRDGDSLEEVQAWVAGRGLGENPAASGYPRGDRRAPAHPGRMGISAHCSGHAVDVHIPWRSASGKGTDVWAWEEIYHQFGLTRPLHRDRGGKGKPEEWHIEETGKELGGDDSLDLLDGVDLGSPSPW